MAVVLRAASENQKASNPLFAIRPIVAKRTPQFHSAPVNVHALTTLDSHMASARLDPIEVRKRFRRSVNDASQPLEKMRSVIPDRLLARSLLTQQKHNEKPRARKCFYVVFVAYVIVSCVRLLGRGALLRWPVMFGAINEQCMANVTDASPVGGPSEPRAKVV